MLLYNSHTEKVGPIWIGRERPPQRVGASETDGSGPPSDWVHDRYDDEPRGMSLNACNPLLILPNSRLAQHKTFRNRSYRNDNYADEPAEEEQ